LKKIVQEWIEKAKADTKTAEREGKVQQDPNWDAVCFHAQQAVEKFLKALLQHHEIVFPKTHDLSDLLDRILAVYPDLVLYKDDLEWLTTFAVQVRYPGESANHDDAQRCLMIMKQAFAAINPIVNQIDF